MFQRITKQDWKALLFFLSIPALGIFYNFLNNSHRGAEILVTDIDHSVPFLPIFVLPYIAWYAFVLFSIIYLCFKDRPNYYRTVAALNLSLIICYIIYFVYQTTVPRPDISGYDSLFIPLVNIVYNMDKPFNCFPSIHVVQAYVVMKGIHQSSSIQRGIKLVTNVMALLIIASTVFIKQHVILDIIGAVLVVESMFLLVYAVESLYQKRRGKTKRERLRRLGDGEVSVER